VHLQPGTPESKEMMFRRLAAMSAVHEHIYSADRYAMLDLSAYLPTLIAGLEDSHGSAATIEHRLAPMEIDADRAYDGAAGTTFTMTFPLAETPAGPPPAAIPPGSAPPASRV
jgi:hypothetical protein